MRNQLGSDNDLSDDSTKGNHPVTAAAASASKMQNAKKEPTT